MKRIGQANKSLCELLRYEIEISLKVFDMSSDRMQLEYNNSTDISVETTVPIRYNVGLFDRFEKKMKLLFTNLPSIKNEGSN